MADAAHTIGGTPRRYVVSNLNPLNDANAVLQSVNGAVGILAEHLLNLAEERGGTDMVNAAYAIGHLLEALRGNLDRFHSAILGGTA